MPEYKKQHYLPIVYLSQFSRSLDVEIESGKRKIWRIGLTSTNCVPIDKQCQKDYFYSKERARISESYFSEIESKYGDIVNSVISGQKLTKESMFLFFLCAVDLYARSFKFKVDEVEDEFEFYLRRIEIFKRNLINRDLIRSSDRQLRDYLLNWWDFSLIPFSEGRNILTSDCPSIWLGSQRNENELKGVLMPITPNYCFVAVHNEYYKIKQIEGSLEDSTVIILNEIKNSIHSVYFSDKPNEEQIASIQKIMIERQYKSQSSEGWLFDLIIYDENPNLTFIDVV